MRVECSELVEQPNAIVIRLSKTDNAAAADCDSGLSHRGERPEAVIVITCSNDLAIKFGRSVEIVVVSGEAGVRQALGLCIVEHSERAADLHTELRDAADHLENTFEI